MNRSGAITPQSAVGLLQQVRRLVGGMVGRQLSPIDVGYSLANCSFICFPLNSALPAILGSRYDIENTFTSTLIKATLLSWALAPCQTKSLRVRD